MSSSVLANSSSGSDASDVVGSAWTPSFLVALIRRDHEAGRKLEEYVAAEAKLSTTPITAGEPFKGAYRSRTDEKVARVRKLLTYLRILDVSADACERYGGLVNELQLKGTHIGDADTMIASIALTQGEVLLTSDKEFCPEAVGSKKGRGQERLLLGSEARSQIYAGR